MPIPGFERGAGDGRCPAAEALDAAGHAWGPPPAHPAPLDFAGHAIHLVCMKRTNVVLDEGILETAVRLSGERTYSAAINRALEEMVRRIRGRQAAESMYGMGEIFWPGYAEEMARWDGGRLSMVRDAAPAEPKPAGGGKRRGRR